MERFAVSKTVVGLGFSSLVVAGAIAGIGAGSAGAVPSLSPVPGGQIRIDVPAGERWNCTVASQRLKFDGGSIAGPPLLVRLAPGDRAFVYCLGNQLPFGYVSLGQAG